MALVSKSSERKIWILSLVLAAGLAWPASTAAVEAEADEGPTLSLADEIGPLSELGVGRSLEVSGTGFRPGADLTVVLTDALGVPVVEAGARIDAGGRFALRPMWPRTGILGCDCEMPPGAYNFKDYEDALQGLAGAVLTLAVAEPASGEVLVARDLPVVEPKGIVGFVADATGCPRFLFGDDEDVYFRAVGTSLEDRFDVVLTTASTAPKEFRKEQPEGDTFAAHGSSTLVRVWSGQESDLGGFIVQVNSTGWPYNVEIMKEDGINSGVVEEDPACMVPPP
ncbi:MAG: hypothetical protein AAFY88_19045 [Acidobacteriota bacterium]